MAKLSKIVKRLVKGKAAKTGEECKRVVLDLIPKGKPTEEKEAKELSADKLLQSKADRKATFTRGDVLFLRKKLSSIRFLLFANLLVMVYVLVKYLPH